MALGDAAGAWQLALLAKPEQMDETILRAVTENALLSDQGTQVCAKLPVLTKTYSAPEWQKVLFVSQLHDKDIKSAQVTLDLLRTQGVKDDLFYTLAERAVTGNTKQLPRQLTPLKPLNLALLRLMEAPLPTELYAHPDAALIAPLLQGKAVDDSARLQLAERGAAKGLVTSTDLAALYQSLSFTPDILAAPLTSHEQGGKLRALLFQAASKETDGVKKAAILKGFIDSLKPTDMNATLARVLTGLLDTITPTDDWNVLSGVFARLYVLDGSKPEGTRTWIKQAHHAEVGLPNVTADLRSIWALLALSGLETPAETAKNLEAWLSSTLAMAEDKTTRTKAATLLLLLDAQGLPVSDDQWALVSDTVTMEKKQIPSPVAFERLRLTGAGGKRGEVVLLSLLATQGGDEPALLTSLETIRALRLAGLIPEAAARAREVAQANDLLN